MPGLRSCGKRETAEDRIAARQLARSDDIATKQFPAGQYPQMELEARASLLARAAALQVHHGRGRRGRRGGGEARIPPGFLHARGHGERSQ